jgi:hypothetical protein
MGLREMARKGLSLFVEMDPESGEAGTKPESAPSGGRVAVAGESEDVQRLRGKSVGELLKELEGPEPEQIQQAVQAAGPVLPAATGGPVDFPTIYAQAQIQPLPFGAEQTLELIQSYPADMPLPLRRQALDATLKTMGRAMNITKEAIVADASRKINALAAYEEAAKQERDAAVAASQEHLRQLQAQTEVEQAKITAAEQQYRSLVERCEAEGHRLDQVQEFLTLDQHATGS